MKVKPKKIFGQNFLIDSSVVKKIVKVAELKSSDTVLEIGPGTGVLTREILKTTSHVLVVEKDRRLIKDLKEEFPEIEVFNEDILKFNQLPSRYKIVANLPFYATSPTIRKFLESSLPPQEMILVVQKEVAQRIVAKPPRMSILSVSVQLYAKAKIVSYISKKSFRPQPEVDAAILKLVYTKPTLVQKEEFFRIVKAGFSNPRKQLINNLKGLKKDREEIEDWLRKNKIEPKQRAETLSVQDWINLSKTIHC